MRASVIGDRIALLACTVVGGLLSAGALSKDRMFFDKAETVARAMMPSFGTPSGIPCNCALSALLRRPRL